MEQKMPDCNGRRPEQAASPWDSVWMDHLYDYRFEDRIAPKASVLFLKLGRGDWDGEKAAEQAEPLPHTRGRRRTP